MLIFNLGIKIILGITVIFFIVFFFLCFSWSSIHTKQQRIVIATTVSFIYSFAVFALGIVLVAVVSLAYQYLPGLF